MADADAHFVDCALTYQGTQVSIEGVGLPTHLMFVGRAGDGGAFHTVIKLKTDGTLDKQWGTDGYITLTSLGATYLSSNSCKEMLRTSDNSMYLAHGESEWPGDAVYHMRFDAGDEADSFVVGDTISNSSGVTATVDQIIYMREQSAVKATVGFVIVSNLAGGVFVNNDVVTGTTQGTGTLDIGASMLDGNYRALTKLDSTGIVDASWAVNGHLPLVPGTSDIWKIIPDSSGNLYILQKTGTVLQVLSKLDSSGNYLWAKKESTVLANREYFLGYHDGILSDDETKLYLCGYGSTFTAMGFNSNIMCVNTSDGTINREWGISGYVECTGSSGGQAYCMVKDSNGGLYVSHKRILYGETYYSILKVNASDGSRDTSWGTDGRAGIDRWAVSTTRQSLAIDDSGNLWAISHPDNGSGSADVSITYLEKYDAQGARTITKTISGVGNNAAQCLLEHHGTIFLGGSRITLDGIDSTLRSYDSDANYIADFPVPDMIAVPNHSADVVLLVGGN